MARLEELVTPTELLDVIRDGALKQDLVKKYRTSDQELAMILVPLYRNGELTKEEFNDFFKGVPLRSRTVDVEGVAAGAIDAPRPSDLPPSQILQALSEVVEDPAVALAEPAAASLQFEEEPRERINVLSAAHSAQGSALGQKGNATQESATARSGLLLVNQRQAGEADASGVSAVDSAGMAGLLDLIFAKLSAIEDRLANIEKKMGSK